MAKRSKRTRRSRRATARLPRRHNKMSASNILKGIVAFTPAAVKALNDAENAGGITTKNGIIKGLLPSISTSYTGYNTNDGKFYGSDLLVGYAPLIAVKVGSKLGLWKMIGSIL